MSNQPKTSLSLDSICQYVAANIPTSEYLIERHSILKGDDYTDVLVTAKWREEYDTVSIQVVFTANSQQISTMQAYIDDENIIDDIDSGVGELFEKGLQDTYPSYDWSYPIGKVSVKCKKIK